MNNFEKIKNLDIYEMSKWLAIIDFTNLSSMYPDNSITTEHLTEHYTQWLQAESEG